MSSAKYLVVPLLLICCLPATAKDKKKKILLPADVLQAQTALVIIDPDAGVSVDAPNANRIAREDVEKALMKWGRFSLAMEPSNADLIIVVRKGNGKIAQPTIGGIPNNDRPVIFEPTDSGGRIGGSRGTPTPSGGPAENKPLGPTQQVEVGPREDAFLVYRGKQQDPLSTSPVWRYMANDALRSPSVPAVDEFRKLILEAEKQQAKQP